ncbi:MAG: ParA family protein [Candidatus Hydrogenedentota bacterium]
MAILLMVNLKGGVAKTANAVAVAECLADEGHKVLLIDADHQCRASELLLGEERQHRCETRRQTLHDLLAEMVVGEDGFENTSIPPFIVEKASNIGGGYENLHVIPCSIRIDDFQSNLPQRRPRHKSLEAYHREMRQRRYVLKAFMQAAYEYVIVDCPSSMALQLRVLMAVADAYVIPAIPDQQSVRGAKTLLDRMRRGNVRSMRPLGLLWSRYRSGQRNDREMLQRAEQGDAPFDELPAPFSAIIPNAYRIAESIEEPNKVHPTFVAKYTEPFARRFQDLCGEICERLNATPPPA